MTKIFSTGSRHRPLSKQIEQDGFDIHNPFFGIINGYNFRVKTFRLSLIDTECFINNYTGKSAVCDSLANIAQPFDHITRFKKNSLVFIIRGSFDFLHKKYFSFFDKYPPFLKTSTFDYILNSFSNYYRQSVISVLDQYGQYK